MIAIDIGNNKGGVAKSTSCINIAVALRSKYHLRILVIDGDISGNCTTGLGVNKYELGKKNIVSLMKGEPFNNCITRSRYGVDVIGNCITNEDDVHAFAGDYVEGTQKLLNAVNHIKEQSNYDIVMLDSPPEFGIMSYNCLYAGDYILIPIQCEPYAVEGMARLRQRLTKMNKPILGIFFTMISERYRLTHTLKADVSKMFGKEAFMFNTSIPRSIKVAEFQYDDIPIIVGDPSNPVSIAYTRLTGEIYGRLPKRNRNG